MDQDTLEKNYGNLKLRIRLSGSVPRIRFRMWGTDREGDDESKGSEIALIFQDLLGPPNTRQVRTLRAGK